VADGEGTWLRVSQEMELLVKEGREPQARSGTMLPPLLDLDRVLSHYAVGAVSTRNQKTLCNYFHESLLFDSLASASLCWHPNPSVQHHSPYPIGDSAFKLSQIFTREASSLPLNPFESSYRSVRATQPSSLPSSEGRPRISSARQSTCDKNRDYHQGLLGTPI
jgi:hypothetical protein